MADEPQEVSTEAVWVVAASVVHPPGIKLDDNGDPVLDEHGDPIPVEGEQAE